MHGAHMCVRIHVDTRENRKDIQKCCNVSVAEWGNFLAREEETTAGLLAYALRKGFVRLRVDAFTVE